MPKCGIERELRGAAKKAPEQLKAVSQTSCGVIRPLGPEIQCVHSNVSDDQIDCVYLAPDEKLIREHATKGGFTANQVVRSANDRSANDQRSLLPQAADTGLLASS